MADYKEMYYSLFVETAKAIELLQEAQLKTERMYATAEDGPMILVPHPSVPKKDDTCD
ncbi:MAG: hypothetical protein FWE69_02820 [Clostridiales bacterium]|nr:hypothetical protein [Clostridiales bacterium]